MSAPAGVYRLTGESGASARKSQKARRRGVGGGGVFRAGKGKEAPAAVRLHRVAQVNRLGVGQTDHGRRMESRADHQAFGQMLIGRLAGEERRTVMGRRSRGIAPVPDEIFLDLRRIDASARPRFRGALSILAHSRSKSISSLAMA